MSKRNDLGIYSDEHAARMVADGRCGRSYRPPNGSEGEIFIRTFCGFCKKAAVDLDVDFECSILTDAWAFEKDDPSYPREWIYGSDGQPLCTAFEERERVSS